MEDWIGSSLNQIQGWTTVLESYSRPLEQGFLTQTRVHFHSKPNVCCLKKRTDGSIFKMCKNWKERKRDRIKLSMRSNRVRRRWRCSGGGLQRITHSTLLPSPFLFSIRFQPGGAPRYVGFWNNQLGGPKSRYLHGEFKLMLRNYSLSKAETFTTVQHLVYSQLYLRKIP